jgi:Escherichia/Staphylococcus phage prohead protease
MKLARKLLDSSAVTLADRRQVTVICSTGEPDRMGDIIIQSGIDLNAYRKNPVVLWGHSYDVPIARAIDIDVKSGKLQATVQFPPEGDDEDSDWVYGKIKAGIVNATSVGVIPRDYEPIDRHQPWLGMKFKKSELLEFSFVSVPANAGCLIVGRSVLKDVNHPRLPSEARARSSRTSASERVARILEAREIATKGRKLAASIIVTPPPTRAQRIAEAHIFRHLAMAAAKR